VFGLAPSIPSPFEITNVTASSMLITWSAAAGASYYQVSIDSNIISNVSGNVTSLPVSRLQPGTRYTFSVTVYDSDDRRGNTVQAHVVTGNVLFINCDLKACPHCRRKVRLYCRLKVRLSSLSRRFLRVSLLCDSVDRALLRTTKAVA